MNTPINIYKSFLLGAVLLLSMSSCEKEIDVDLRSVPPRIVIEGIVKKDQLATVRVSQTIDFNNNDGYPNLSGAIVKISDDAGNSETLKQDQTGWYTAEKLKGEIGKKYHLSVTYEGEEYTSTSQMPPQVPLDSITMKKVPIMDYGFPLVHFRDPIGETNQYYRCLLFINGKQHPDVMEFIQSAELMDGHYFHDPLQVYINDDDIDPIYKGDEITVEFQCIDKGTYKFFFTLFSIGQSPTNAISNISNGALGYFSACTAERKTIIADWED